MLRLTLFQQNVGYNCMIFTLTLSCCLRIVFLIFLSNMDVLPVRPPMAPLIIRTFFTYMSIHDKYNQIKLLFFFVD